MEMLEDVSRAKDAESAFRAYAKRIRRVRPVDAYASISTANLAPGEFRVMRTHRAKGGEFESVAPAPKDIAALPIRRGGFVGSIINKREPQLYQDMKPASDPVPDPVLGDLMSGMGSCMCVPMFHAGRIDAWSLMFRADPRGYTLEDLEDDLLIGNLLGSMTLNMSSVERITQLNGALREQFDQVARVQKALLPSSLPQHPGVRFATSYLTSDQAGGDYYDFFDLDHNKLGVLIADVSGHGPAAATIMAMLHARPDVCDSPAGALKFANARLAASSIEGTHVTGVFTLLDLTTRTLAFSRAGHPIPRIRASDGTVRPLGGGAGEGAAPMGIVPDHYDPRESTVQLHPGETVILYTDGITEAENPAGEQLGVEALDRAISVAPDDPDQIIKAVERAVESHANSPIRGDDQTLVVFRIES